MVTLAQAHMQLLEVTGGEVEYDVHRREPGSEDSKNLTTSVDAQCPQQQPFGVLRCTGHLHIGKQLHASTYLCLSPSEILKLMCLQVVIALNYTMQ